MKLPPSPLRIGTRGSPLALWQADWTAHELRVRSPGRQVEIVKIRTLAEKFPDRAVAEIGVGIFTKELDEALLRGEVDLAVHSLKDVPSELHPELALAAVPERESPFDAWISAGGSPFASLPPGAKVGTGSPRRKAQLLRRRPDLEVVPLRGNVATRLRKIEEQGLAGTVLAHAGLRRLGEAGRITEILGVDLLVPAVSQGALGLVCLQTRADLREILAPLEHTPTRASVTAERAFLRRLRGGCQVPAGALATVETDGRLRLVAVIASPDGSRLVRGERSAALPAAESLGNELAAQLLEEGGAEILGKVRP